MKTIKAVISLAIGSSMLLAVAGASAANPTHQFRLDGDLKDDMGGTPLVAAGGTFGESGYTFGRNQGLSLAANLGSSYTIDFQFSFASYGGYQKILDFSGLNSDQGLYTVSSNYAFYPFSSNLGRAAGRNELARVTITRSQVGVFNLYRDGLRTGSFMDTLGSATQRGNVLSFFMDDRATGGSESAAGYVDYIRTFNYALSDTEVKNMSTVLTPVPEPTSYMMFLAGLGLCGTIIRKRKKTAASL